jgi:hypothetical protein
MRADHRIHRDTIMRLGARVGRGCAELHDRTPAWHGNFAAISPL